MGLVLPPSAQRKFEELLHDILLLANSFQEKSEPQMVLVIIAQLLQHFLYARGAYLSQIEECMSDFRQGKLEKLWELKIKTDEPQGHHLLDCGSYFGGAGQTGDWLVAKNVAPVGGQ